MGAAPGVAPMGVPPPGAPGLPGSAPVVPEKKKRPSIILMILDFLVFGGAIAAMILLFITN
jgi:hypothetical protein